MGWWERQIEPSVGREWEREKAVAWKAAELDTVEFVLKNRKLMGLLEGFAQKSGN